MVEAASATATATAAGIDSLKDLLLSVYKEQLWSRPKPETRSEKGWSKILNTALDQCRARLQEFHTPEEVLSFSFKCLRDPEWKNKFLELGLPLLTDNCVPETVLQNFVHPSEEVEAASFERDFALISGVFAQRLTPAVSAEPVDLEQGQSFQCALREASAAIDLD